MKFVESFCFRIRKCWVLLKMFWSEFCVQAIIIGLILLLNFILNKFTEHGINETDFLKLLGSVLTIMVGLFVYKAQKRVLNWDIRNRLICEFDEIHRHLQRNLEVLDAIKDSMSVTKKVSVIHIEKLRIAINQTFTDDELLKNMSKKYTYMVFPLSVKMRNYNITVDHLKEAWKENKKILFESYLDEVIVITQKLQEKIYDDSKAKLAHKIKTEPGPTRTLIYDGKW